MECPVGLGRPEFLAINAALQGLYDSLDSRFSAPYINPYG